jgi:hypothetical protein
MYFWRRGASGKRSSGNSSNDSNSSSSKAEEGHSAQRLSGHMCQDMFAGAQIQRACRL